MSTFGGLSISISGLYANKKSLDTISHNISNVNTSGYVRQQALHESAYYKKIAGGFKAGTGANVQQIRQIRDEFLDMKFRDENEKFGYWESKSNMMQGVESIFNEVTDSGIQKIMDQFWNGWEELSKHSDSLTIRGLVHERAVAFTEAVNHIRTQLDSLQLNLNKDIDNNIFRINNIIKGVSDLNQKIRDIESTDIKVKANDLRDKRNNLIDELSGMIPITTEYASDGSINVSTKGRLLVVEDQHRELTKKQNDKGYNYLAYKKTGDKIDLNEDEGQIAGLISVRDKEIEEMKLRLNLFVNTVAKAVNEEHKNGYDLLGNSVSGSDAEKFFTTKNGTGKIEAGNILVNPELSDYNKIAASSNGDTGNGKIAEYISGLRNKQIFNDIKNPDGTINEKGTITELLDKASDYDGTPLEGLIKEIDTKQDEYKSMTSDDFYRNLILKIGLSRGQARSIAKNQTILIGQIDGKRQSISGVSLDEEMTAMMKYQHSYVANSRVINAIDGMIENIINKMGIVGR